MAPVLFCSSTHVCLADAVRVPPAPLALAPQMFMFGTTADLVALSTEVSFTVFKWTTGWGFFFGGLLFTCERARGCPYSTAAVVWQAAVPRRLRREDERAGQLGSTQHAVQCAAGGAPGWLAASPAEPACVLNDPMPPYSCFPCSRLAAGMHGGDGQLVAGRAALALERPSQHQLGGRQVPAGCAVGWALRNRPPLASCLAPLERVARPHAAGRRAMHGSSRTAGAAPALVGPWLTLPQVSSPLLALAFQCFLHSTAQLALRCWELPSCSFT